METIKEDISEQLPAVKEKYRSEVDLLLSRIDLLSGRDRLLMTMFWEKGNSLSQIGKLAQINRNSLARRINTVTERLMEGKYIACMRNRRIFTGRQLDIAKDYFLTGLSMKRIARRRKLSYYQVRKMIKIIESKLEPVERKSTQEAPLPLHQQAGKKVRGK